MYFSVTGTENTEKLNVCLTDRTVQNAVRQGALGHLLISTGLFVFPHPFLFEVPPSPFLRVHQI